MLSDTEDVASKHNFTNFTCECVDKRKRIKGIRKGNCCKISWLGNGQFHHNLYLGILGWYKI
jgi:hypothetical protein